jgi:hypothetical protein
MGLPPAASVYADTFRVPRGCVHVLLYIYIFFKIFLGVISVIEIPRTQTAVNMAAEDSKNL